MPYILNLNSSKISRPHTQFPTFPFETEIDIFSNQHVGMRAGDEFVFMEPMTPDDSAFTFYGVIVELRQPADFALQPDLDEPRGRYKYTLSLRVNGILKDDNLLSDLAYSLTKVWRFDKPSIHFRRSYSYLAPADYATIIRGRSFVSRTALGIIANALPLEHRLAFVRLALEEMGNSFFRGGDYIAGLSLLRRYIEGHILAPGRQLIAVNGLASRLLPPESLAELGFLADGEESAELIGSVIPNFARLFESERDLDMWRNLSDEAQSQRDVERELSRVFAGRPWPILLEGWT